MLEEIESIYAFNVKFKGVQLICKVENGVVNLIESDRYRLMQIIVNLIGNAFKFTFEGSITLKVTKFIKSQGQLMTESGTDSNKEPETKLKFEVIDTGMGIKEKDLSNLFKAFGKIKQDDSSINSQGVGLGLNISNEIVKILNKDENEHIEVESEFGKGTTFSFVVPYKEGQEQSRKDMTNEEEAEESFHEVHDMPKPVSQ